MEATGSDGGRGPSLPWSYRGDQIGSNNPYGNTISSSSSGTIVSTTYTSHGSRLSSISMDAVRHFELALDEDAEVVQPTKKSRKEREERMKHMRIKSLVKEFFGVPSAECSINIDSISGDMSVLERWFSELGVAWILHLPDGDDAPAELHHTLADAAYSWIGGLHRTLETIRTINFTFEDYAGLLDVFEEDGQPEPESDKQANNVLDQIHYARFTKEAMSKMLSFVDLAIRQVFVCINGMPPPPYMKLDALLRVHRALFDAAYEIQPSQIRDYSEGVIKILHEMLNLVLAKLEEAGDAIWTTMERIRTHVQDSIDIAYHHDSSSSVIAQASSDIHEATLSVMEYIRFLRSNTSQMRGIVYEAVRLGKCVPQTVESIVMGMMSYLQEKLVKMSESFPDQGLRFLFLLNNFECIRQSLVDNHIWYGVLLHEEGERLSEKVEAYMKNYLQACWEPMLPCLFSPTPLCFGVNHSPLSKFESEFKKTYTTQKLWKVPDPKLRERLRRAITKKIVPRYTEYIEENNITTPGVAPQDLEKMLQELFEG